MVTSHCSLVSMSLLVLLPSACYLSFVPIDIEGETMSLPGKHKILWGKEWLSSGWIMVEWKKGHLSSFTKATCVYMTNDATRTWHNINRSMYCKQQCAAAEVVLSKIMFLTIEKDNGVTHGRKRLILELTHNFLPWRGRFHQCIVIGTALPSIRSASL